MSKEKGKGSYLGQAIDFPHNFCSDYNHFVVIKHFESYLDAQRNNLFDSIDDWRYKSLPLKDSYFTFFKQARSQWKMGVVSPALFLKIEKTALIFEKKNP